MREPMTRLAGFAGRRRRWVLAGWLLVLVLALPLASRQTDHLTGGGFDVPGSQSKAVNDALERDFGGDATGIAVLLRSAPGAGAVARAAAVGQVRRTVAGIDRVTLPPPFARRAELALRRKSVAMLPLRSDLSSDRLVDAATTLREELDPGAARGGVTAYSPGSRQSGPGCRSCPRKTWPRRRSAAFRSSR